MIIIDFAVMVILSISFTYINSQGVIDGPGPELHNFIFTLIYLLIWLAYSFRKGRLGRKTYLIFSTTFWIIGMLLLLLCINLTATPLWAISIYYVAPLNGLNYVFQYSLPFNTLLFFVISLSLSYLGFYLGYRKYNKGYIV